ncbi:unnamed protein product [Pocillopora meandrina]|uniref:Uncharacterized protein n=1 Tax=Pocillopora meandrina TaxID=46732 RepID=A0AAU9WKW8_9CNID|nr:unnamed protein product [Pocillopora meandrina]
MPQPKTERLLIAFLHRCAVIQILSPSHVAYRPTGIRSRAAVTTGLLHSYDPSKQVTLKRRVYRQWAETQGVERSGVSKAVGLR